jgi:hypothetical protein
MDALGNLRGVKQSDQKSSPETNDDGEEQA